MKYKSIQKSLFDANTFFITCTTDLFLQDRKLTFKLVQSHVYRHVPPEQYEEKEWKICPFLLRKGDQEIYFAEPWYKCLVNALLSNTVVSDP